MATITPEHKAALDKGKASGGLMGYPTQEERRSVLGHDCSELEFLQEATAEQIFAVCRLTAARK